MKNWTLVFCLLAILLGMSLVQPRKAVHAAEVIKVNDIKADPAPVTVDEAGARRTLTLRQCRKVGATWKNLKQTAIALNEKGELSHHSGLAAAQVFAELEKQNPKAWQDEKASIDWQALLDFIERLMQLILKLFILDTTPIDPGICCAPVSYYMVA